MVALCYHVARLKWFSTTLLVVVFGNTICLSADHYGISNTTALVLEVANQVFAVVFGVELAVNLVGYGYNAYFASLSNWFDALIVLFSVLEVALQGGRLYSLGVRASHCGVGACIYFVGLFAIRH